MRTRGIVEGASHLPGCFGSSPTRRPEPDQASRRGSCPDGTGHARESHGQLRPKLKDFICRLVRIRTEAMQRPDPGSRLGQWRRVAAQTLVPSIYLALITCAGCWVGGLLTYPSLASGELRATLSRTLAEIGMAVSGCAYSFELGSRNSIKVCLPCTR